LPSFPGDSIVDDSIVDDPFNPVFLVGPPRTGSKMYQYILMKHTNIAIMPEIQYKNPWWLKADFERSVAKKIGDLNNDRNLSLLLKLMYSGELVGTFWKDMVLDREKLTASIMESDRSYQGILKALLSVFAESKGRTTPGAKFPVYVSYTPLLSKFINKTPPHNLQGVLICNCTVSRFLSSA